MIFIVFYVNSPLFKSSLYQFLELTPLGNIKTENEHFSSRTQNTI